MWALSLRGNLTCVRCRYHQGAMLWWFAVVWPWPFLFVSIKVYEDSNRVKTISLFSLWATAACLLVTWVAVNVLFFSLIRRPFLRTFVVVETAAEYTKRTKWDGSTDARKAKVITRLHHSICRLFRDEARQWLDDGFPRWEAENPDW